MSRLVVTKHRPFENTRLDQCEPLPALRDAAAMLARSDVYVDAGTLLGIIRDGQLIPYDFDIDFTVLVDRDRPGRLAELDKDFDLIRTIDVEGRPMQRAYMRDRVIVDLYFSWRGIEEGVAINETDEGIIRTPLNLVEPLKMYGFEGAMLNVPRRTSDYLFWRYGTAWKTPTGSKVPFPQITVCLEKTG